MLNQHNCYPTTELQRSQQSQYRLYTLHTQRKVVRDGGTMHMCMKQAKQSEIAASHNKMYGCATLAGP